MIDLDSIALVFMDFDDTLCIRTKRTPNKDYYKSMISRDSDFYVRSGRKVGSGMIEFASQCKLRTIKLYVLTWSNSNLCYHAEKKWLDDAFSKGVFEDVLIASSREYKIEVMKIFSDVKDVPRSGILFVDDVPEILDKAYNEGFCVASPQEIALQFS